MATASVPLLAINGKINLFARMPASCVLNYFWDQSLPVKLATIARAMGVQILPFVADTDSQAQLVWDAERKQSQIFYDPSLGNDTARWVIVHCLGHHSLRHRPDSPDTKRTDEEEAEANLFALELLMPGAALKKILSGGEKIELRSEYFDIFTNIFHVPFFVIAPRIQFLDKEKAD